MIADGRIRVNGDKAKVGMKIDPDNNDSITLDGIPIHLSSSPSPTPSSSHPLLPQRMTLVVNKPGNVLSAAGSDEWGRQTVVELAMKHLKSTTSSSCNHDDDDGDGDGDGDLSMLRLYPVGRLDLHTTGLILVTNEGELAHRIAHPKYELEKEYHAVVKGNVDQDTVRWLEQGVALNDGMTHPAKVAILDNNAAPSGGRKGKAPSGGKGKGKGNTTRLSLTIHEGRNRIVRRMCAAVGHPCVALHRARIGPIHDPHLALGALRPLTPAERRSLHSLLHLSI